MAERVSVSSFSQGRMIVFIEGGIGMETESQSPIKRSGTIFSFSAYSKPLSQAITNEQEAISLRGEY